MEAFFNSLLTPGVTVLYGPSGSGKTTVLEKVKERFPDDFENVIPSNYKKGTKKILIVNEWESGKVMAVPGKRIIFVTCETPIPALGVDAVDVREL